jgi:hypothetical protein
MFQVGQSECPVRRILPIICENRVKTLFPLDKKRSLNPGTDQIFRIKPLRCQNVSARLGLVVESCGYLIHFSSRKFRFRSRNTALPLSAPEHKSGSNGKGRPASGR